MQKPKWIFFDLGSTLIDETEVYAHRFRETVYGASISVSVLQESAERFWAQGLDGYPEACRSFQLAKAPWRSEFERPFDGCAAVLGALEGRDVSGMDDFEMLSRIEELTGTKAPQQLKALKNAAPRFTGICTKEDMESAVYALLHIS